MIVSIKQYYTGESVAATGAQVAAKPNSTVLYSKENKRQNYTKRTPDVRKE